MRAFVATVRIVIDPAVVGPDAKTEWTSDASASDWMSALLSENPEVLDWAYDAQRYASPDWQYGTPWRVVEINPDEYEEGEFLGLIGAA